MVMVISVTQSSKLEFADWLGVIGTTVVAERVFHKIGAIFHEIRATPRLYCNNKKK